MALQLYQPVIMNQIIDYLNVKDRALLQGIIFFSVIFLITFVSSIIGGHVSFQFEILGMNLSNTLGLLIFNKTLKHPLLT